jgi:endonuclease III
VNANKKPVKKLYEILEKEYPGATTALKYKKPHELLFATILSAQCTDKRVNIVTKELFKKYRSVGDFARAGRGALEKEIRSTGFFRSKAGNLIASASRIEKEFGGKVPKNMEDLVSLPGVARKTANIVLFHAFGKTEGIAVDTHVKRVSGRLGLTENTDPVKIERDLMEIFEKSEWGHVTNILIAHGRKVCRAGKPICWECPVKTVCPYPGKGEYVKAGK